jgi:hypothetical protein
MLMFSFMLKMDFLFLSPVYRIALESAIKPHTLKHEKVCRGHNSRCSADLAASGTFSYPQRQAARQLKE